jgi:hypothetical protein
MFLSWCFGVHLGFGLLARYQPHSVTHVAEGFSAVEEGFWAAEEGLSAVGSLEQAL